MTDLIDRQAAIDAIDKEYRCTDQTDDWDGLKTAMLIIENLPSVQPERETAKFIRWMEIKKTDEYISYTPHCKCSKCETEFLINTIKYCYVCGARMEDNDD